MLLLLFFLVEYGKIYSFKQVNYCNAASEKYSAVYKGNKTESDRCNS